MKCLYHLTNHFIHHYSFILLTDVTSLMTCLMTFSCHASWWIIYRTIRCIMMHPDKEERLKAIRDMCSGEQQHSYCAHGKKLPAYELCIKIQFPETFCWWEDLPPKTNQVKLFIGLLLFNCHWHREETLAPLEFIWPGHMLWGVYMSWTGSQFPSEQMNSTTSLFPTSYLGICQLKWLCRL